MDDCKRRNILYESSCPLCEKKQESKETKGLQGGAVYVGEYGRSIFERAGEHWHDAEAGAEDSHMWKHWHNCHGDSGPVQKFKIKVVSSFRDALTRQVAESVRIDRRGGQILNSKTEYSRCRLPRLVLEKTDWEKEAEARKLEAELKRVKDKEMESEVDRIFTEEGVSVWEIGLGVGKVKLTRKANRERKEESWRSSRTGVSLWMRILLT